jgi:hypothetical protein
MEEMHMIQIGKKQCLNVVKVVDFGVYLGQGDETVLLPKKQVPPDTEVGDALTVFVYRDSSDRLIATMREPKIQLNEIRRLKVAQVTKIGAFMDWGLEKDVLLPFKEQACPVKQGEEYLVVLYIDKSNRLAASMRRVYNYLTTTDEYVADSLVTGTIIELSEDYGAYVAVEDRYYGLIPRNDIYSELNIGDIVHCRVAKVREDGKLTLSLRKKAYLQMDEDARVVWDMLVEAGGRFPFNDKAAPELIRSQFNMSKNEFKRAVGRLLKEKKIVINPDSIQRVDNQ